MNTSTYVLLGFVILLLVLYIIFLVLWYKEKNNFNTFKTKMGEMRNSLMGYPACYQQDWSKIRFPNPNSKVDWIFPNYDPNTAKAIDPKHQGLLEETLKLKSSPAQCGNWCVYNPSKNISFWWDNKTNVWTMKSGAQCGSITNDLATAIYDITKNAPTVTDKTYKPYFN